MDEERILINCDCYFYFLLFLLSNNRRDEYPLLSTRASLVAQLVKILPGVQETQVQSLGGEDPLEKEMANHSSILTWKIPWTDKSGGLQFKWSQRVEHD